MVVDGGVVITCGGVGVDTSWDWRKDCLLGEGEKDSAVESRVATMRRAARNMLLVKRDLCSFIIMIILEMNSVPFLRLVLFCVVLMPILLTEFVNCGEDGSKENTR